ncbi:MAG: hypothetical protein IJT98_03950 [Prevotella sp.]|nr:hypothetical protein [Prevotella sp.]
MYVWQQSDWMAQPMRASREGVSFTDQEMISAAWTGASTIPAYDQRKDIRLWIPHPEGVGTNQSKTFTFYGITTPQPSDYVSTLPSGSDYRKVQLQFKVTYPNPMKPSTSVTKTYTATLVDDPATTDVDENVYFEAGYNTTINISLNHKNEQMTVGAEYENWQFVATPDVGQLKKNSTFLQDTSHDGTNVTIVGDDNATIDDATWLYELNGTIYDIYGHTGTESDPYQISTAYQMLSFAYEVKNGRDFSGKFIRLDADITLQKESGLTKEEIIPTEDNAQAIANANNALSWIGIGDDTHAFNGTFLGGNRFIYRLYGSPLFTKLGTSAKIEQLQVQALTVGNGSGSAVDGNGLFAETNAGMICACKVVGDVVLSGSTAGAFVGENTGIVWTSYHIGQTKSTVASATVGGLVGTNSGTIASCYQAGKVDGGTTLGGITGTNTGTLDNNYYNSTLLTNSVSLTGVTGKSTSDMTKQTFVTDINVGIATWQSTHTDYDEHSYVYQPANYPKLSQ